MLEAHSWISSPLPPLLVSRACEGFTLCKTTEKGLKHHGAFVPACLSPRVFTFLKPGWGYSCETWAVFQNPWTGLLAGVEVCESLL